MKLFSSLLFAAVGVSVASADDLNFLVMADWGGAPSNPYTTPEEYVLAFFFLGENTSRRHVPYTHIYVPPWYRLLRSVYTHNRCSTLSVSLLLDRPANGTVPRWGVPR